MTPSDDASTQPQTSVDERLLIIETELRTFTNSLRIVGPSLAIVFGLLGIALAWNVTSERGDLEQFRKEIKDDVKASLGQNVDEPNIVLLTKDG